MIIGMPAAGKTVVAARVAERVALPCLDLDALLQAENGRSAAELLRREGETVFRIHEAALLEQVLSGPPTVIAVGGGAPCFHNGIERMRAKAQVVWLDAPVEVLSERALLDDTDRPLLGDTRQSAKAALVDLELRRRATYAQAHVHVDAAQPLNNVVNAVLCALDPAESLLSDDLASATHPVWLHGGAPAQAVEALVALAAGSKIALVIDRGVAQWAQPLVEMLKARGVDLTTIDVAGGEKSKDLRTASRIWSALAAAGVGRSDLLVAIGGGATTDVAGFCAATWQRGMRTALIPTTVLAMADASVGAKTAIDTPEGKNLVGAFHRPEWVWLPLQVLQTLPARQFRAGLAEIAKIFVSFDAGAWRALLADGPALRRRSLAALLPHLRAAVRHKAAVVAADPLERQGPGHTSARALLNLGHTLGHAIEAQSKFAVLHGEAVALGLVAEAEAAESTGVAATGTAQAVRLGLEALGFDTQWERWATAATLARIVSDKKRRGQQLWLPQLRGVGQAELLAVDAAAWQTRLAELGATAPTNVRTTLPAASSPQLGGFAQQRGGKNAD